MKKSQNRYAMGNKDKKRPNTLAGRMATERGRLGITQEDLARLANTTPSSIAKIEAGGTLMPRNIQELSRVLGRSAGYLLFGEPDHNDEQDPALNEALLNEIIRDVEAFLGRETLTLPPDRKAALVIALYRILSTSGGQVSGTTIRIAFDLISK